MKNRITVAICALIISCLAFFAFPVQADEIKDFVNYEYTGAEMTTFNILFSQWSAEFNVLTNCIDPLLTHDNHGRLIPNLAEEWGTEDNGKTWDFKVREGAKWVDYKGEIKADCVPEDWLWSMEWILNFHKNESANTFLPIQMIEGAKEYYEYTKGLDAEEGLKLGLDKFKEMVGIEIIDGNTLRYHCTSELPYFDTLATYCVLYPLSGKLLEELGAEGYKAVDNETLWYNGPYTITTFVDQNEKVLTKNPEYWNQDVKRFDTVTIKMVESGDTAYQLFQTGEIDRVSLSDVMSKMIYEKTDHEFHDYLTETRSNTATWQMHFNYNKYIEPGEIDENWNKAVANDAFRLSWYYGLDLTPVLERINPLKPASCACYNYSIPGLVSDSKGTDYADLVLQRIGIERDPDKFVRYDEEKAKQYKEQAISELTEQGVTFPVTVDYFVQAGDQGSLDSAIVLQHMFKECLGEDYINFNIREYATSYLQEVLETQLGSFYLNKWTPDFGDPISILGQEIYGEDNAYFAQTHSFINQLDPDAPIVQEFKEFTELVKEANAINDDMDARVNKFADAEAYFLEHAFTIPYFSSMGFQLTKVNVYSQIYSPYGIQYGRYVNWETNDQIYTAEEYEQLAQEYEAGK